MKPEIERLEIAAGAGLGGLAEYLYTGRLLAEAVMDGYEYEYDDRSYCGCCGRSFGLGDLDEHLVHGAGCPVLDAERIIAEDES